MFRELNQRYPVVSLSITVLGNLALWAFIGLSVWAQPVPSPTPTPEPTIPLKDYREVLEKERKILEDQSKEYYARVEKFAYASLGSLVVALTALITFFGWLFGKTREEVVNQVKADLQRSVLSSASAELEQVKKEKIEAIESEYTRLKAQLEALSSFGQQRLVWLLRKSMAKPVGEIDALAAVGLRRERIEPLAPTPDDEAEIKKLLADADLVIVTFDGSDEAKTLLRHAATAIKFRQPPVSLLIYTYGFYFPDGRPMQLKEEELQDLKGVASFAPANFPATLVSQAQSLILKAKV